MASQEELSSLVFLQYEGFSTVANGGGGEGVPVKPGRSVPRYHHTYLEQFVRSPRDRNPSLVHQHFLVVARFKLDTRLRKVNFY